MLPLCYIKTGGRAQPNLASWLLILLIVKAKRRLELLDTFSSSATNYFIQIVHCCCSCFGREITTAPFENEHTFEQKE